MMGIAYDSFSLCWGGWKSFCVVLRTRNLNSFVIKSLWSSTNTGCSKIYYAVLKAAICYVYSADFENSRVNL